MDLCQLMLNVILLFGEVNITSYHNSFQVAKIGKKEKFWVKFSDFCLSFPTGVVIFGRI